MLLWSIYCCSTSSTTQHSATNPVPWYNAASIIRADQSDSTKSSCQSWPEATCRRAVIQLAMLSRRTKKSKSDRPQGQPDLCFFRHPPIKKSSEIKTNRGAVSQHDFVTFCVVFCFSFFNYLLLEAPTTTGGGGGP